MSNKTIGIILIVVGVLVIIADIILGLTGFSSLGIGVGFGYKKIILAAAGVIIALIGIFMQMQKTNPAGK
jgi:hypothetical protein